MPAQTIAPSFTDTEKAAAAIRAVVEKAAARSSHLEHAPAGLGHLEAMSWHLERATTTARAGWNPASGNVKTGPVATLTTDRTTCPSDGACKLRATARDGGGDHAARMAAGERVQLTLAGCYADGGPLAWYWNQLTRGEKGGTWADTCRQVASTRIPRKNARKLARLLQAGDLPTDAAGQVDWHAVAALAHALAHAGLRAWGYTHHRATPRLVAILDALEEIAGATLVLSANDRGHADALRAAYPHRPIAVVVPADTPRGAKTPGGATLAACPAQLGDTTCDTCGGPQGPLCARPSGPRPLVVAFRAHGSAQQRAELVAAGGGA